MLLNAKLSHPDHDGQFEHINNEAKKAVENGNPVLSINAKRKENIDSFKNNGHTDQSQKTSVEVLDDDFPIAELGQATPFGVYSIFKNKGFVNVGLSSDTAIFAVESIRKWWYAEGVFNYENAEKIILTVDCGDTNSNCNGLWKSELQKLTNEINKDIQVLYYPSGLSKWNKIEHRMIAFICKNWHGIPFISSAIIVNVIDGTKAENGFSIGCIVDEQAYEKGTDVTDEELDSVHIKKDEFHGDFNYTICYNTH
jgi:hypothetical protein